MAGSTLRRSGYGQVPTLLLNAASGLLSLVGAWLLTTPDPSGLGEDRYGTSRRVIRVTLVFGLAQQLMVLAQSTGNWPPAVNLLFTVAGIVAGLIAVVGKFATLHFLGKLARRIPDPALERRARLIMYGYGIPLAAVTVVGGVMLALTRGGAFRGRPGSAFIGLGCAGGIAVVTLIVFGLMYLFMLGRFAKAFKAQAAFARATWAADPSPAAPPST